MIIPSIDLQGGQAVQLINGETLAIEAGDPAPIAQRFGMVGPIAVIDLDAALGTGENREIIRRLCRSHRCRVGGGIRDISPRLDGWMPVPSTSSSGRPPIPSLSNSCPKIASSSHWMCGKMRVVDGWRRSTGQTVEQQMKVLRPFVDGFLVTFVESEGLMKGTRMDRIDAPKAAAGDCHLTIAEASPPPRRFGCWTTKAWIAKSEWLCIPNAFGWPTP